MEKQELEELRRLEAELMESEYIEEDLTDEIGLVEDTWQELADFSLDAYNTDSLDVELEDFSREISQGKDKGPVFPTVLILLLLGVVVFCAMKIWGVV